MSWMSVASGVYLLGGLLTLVVSLREWLRDGVGFDEIVPAAVINLVLWPIVVPVVLVYRLFLVKERIKA